MATALAWRYLVDPPLPGATNMARDHALASSVGAGEGVVRFYRWQTPTVSFGRNEAAAEAYRALTRDPDLDFVRRPTGGRAVLHREELTYAVVFPKGSLGRLRESYRVIHEGLMEGLAALGVVGVHSGESKAAPPHGGPCFALPAPGEIVVDGRKLVGSAQARIGSAILQHGSLLLTCDQRRLYDVRGETSPGPVGAVTLLEVLGRIPKWEELVDALVAGLATRLEGPVLPGSMRAAELEAEASLMGRYRCSGWTWRR